MKVRYQSNRSKLPVAITDHSKAVLSSRFYLFYVRCCSIFKCFFILTHTFVQFISVTVTESPPVSERAVNSGYISPVQ